MATDEILPVDRLVELLDEFGFSALKTVEEQGIARVMNVLEAKAVEITPVDTGNLESSTVVRVQKRGANIVEGTLTFNAPYAATVHELPETSRGPRTRQKPGNEFGRAGPKYLERPLRGFQRRLTEDIGRFLQEIWRGGRRGGRGRSRGSRRGGRRR